MSVDRFVRKVAGFRPDTIVHVGAHQAEELERYEALGPRRVVWIEADTEIVPKTRQKVSTAGSPDIDHVCVEALVTDVDAQDAALNVFNNSGASSSIFRSTETLRSTWPGLEETGEVRRLKSSRLDTLLRRHGVDPGDVDILILDTQGAELLCLKGAGAYLDHVGFIEVEASQEAIYEGGVLFPELDSYLNGVGFARVSPVPWHGDIVYVRKADLTRAGHRSLRRRAAAPDGTQRRRRTPRILRRLFGRS